MPGERTLDPDSARWVADLAVGAPGHDAAVGELHAMLLAVARREAGRRVGQHGLAGAELDDLAHQAAADAVVSILGKLDDFRGESRFTTWAYKFAVFELSSKVGRHVWRRDGVAWGDEVWEQLPDRLGGRPEAVAEGRELVDVVRAAVDAELTEHQRRVFVAVVLDGVPLDVLAAELGTNRNALYKTMFDARRKLRRHLTSTGFLGEAAR